MSEYEIELEDGSKIVLNRSQPQYDADLLLADHNNGRLKIKEDSLVLLYNLSYSSPAGPEAKEPIKSKSLDIDLCKVDMSEYYEPTEQDLIIRKEILEETVVFRERDRIRKEKEEFMQKQFEEFIKNKGLYHNTVVDLMNDFQTLSNIEIDQEIENLKG